MSLVRQPIAAISGEKDRYGRIALNLACSHTSFSLLEGHYRVGETRFCHVCTERARELAERGEMRADWGRIRMKEVQR